jgi:antitoxin (DNA-binding transcriptional repressor) of toxin-antitoxin stability system
MKFANVRDLKINSNTILRGLSSEDVVITKQGKPVAAIIYMDEDLLDSFVIAHHPTLLSGVEKDLDLWKRGKLRTYSLEEVKTRLLGRRRSGRSRSSRPPK